MKVFLPLVTIAFLFSCSENTKQETTSNKHEQSFKLFAAGIKDTYNITVHLPAEYFDSVSKKYPVVFLTDANFYYPMLSSTLQQYETGGLLPPVILVGIGYKSFEAMDSLRQRDYLYPAALPSDELTTSGGGKNFYDFITTALETHIDSLYRTNTIERTLLGHSFGGYFISFAAMEQIENKRKDFKNFVSASPSLWYHNFYMNQLPGKLKDYNDTLGLFITVGGKEDTAWSIKPVTDISKKITELKKGNIIFETQVYNSLDHMDVGMLSFIKGLQKFYPVQ